MRPASRGIARLGLKLYVATADEPGVRRLWSELLERLPLFCTMRAVFPIDLELTITP